MCVLLGITPVVKVTPHVSTRAYHYLIYTVLRKNIPPTRGWGCYCIWNTLYRTRILNFLLYGAVHTFIGLTRKGVPAYLYDQYNLTQIINNNHTFPRNKIKPNRIRITNKKKYYMKVGYIPGGILVPLHVYIRIHVIYGK
jgi:hypothetical protein